MASTSTELKALLETARSTIFDTYNPATRSLRSLGDEAIASNLGRVAATLDNAIRMCGQGITPVAKNRRLVVERSGSRVKEPHYVVLYGVAGFYYVGEHLTEDQCATLVEDPDWEVQIRG